MTRRDSRGARIHPATAAAVAATTAVVLLLGACGRSATTTADEAAVAGTIEELPLTRGFHVSVDASCATASNATLALVHRTGINSSQEVCELSSIERISPQSYRAIQACSRLQGGEGGSGTVVLDIADPMGFGIGAEGSNYRSHYRYCEQSSLPEPWRDNDISDLVQ